MSTEKIGPGVALPKQRGGYWLSDRRRSSILWTRAYDILARLTCEVMR